MVSFLDGLVSIFLIWWGFLGFRRGFIEELSRLVGVVTAFIVTQSYSSNLVLELRKYISIDSWILLMVSSIFLFGGTLMLVRFSAQFLHQFLVTKSSRLVDKFLGITFGLIKGSILVVLVVWGISVSPKQGWAEIIIDSSRIVRTFMEFRDSTFERFNIEDPMDKIRSNFPVIKDRHDGNNIVPEGKN